MRKAYKFWLYPPQAQLTKMEQTLELCRWTVSNP
ncbi:MAG: helix-turn-helix domain-containing protein [Methanotrichaceae archaeon]